MDDRLKEQYENLMAMAEDARKKCLDSGGHIVPLLKNKRGRTVPNPYLDEYHKLIKQARGLARELGIVEGAEGETSDTLYDATKRGGRAERLATLALILADSIDRCKGHGMAALAREYRETILEEESLGAQDDADDPIARMVAAHRQAGSDNERLSLVQP